MSNVVLMGKLKNNYTQLDNNILYDGRLKSTDKCIFWFLLDQAQQMKKPVSQKRIAQELHMAKQTVVTSMGRLQECGLLDIKTNVVKDAEGKLVTRSTYYLQVVDVTCDRMVNQANNEQSLEQMAKDLGNYGMTRAELEQQEQLDKAIAELEQQKVLAAKTVAYQSQQENVQEPARTIQVQILAEDNKKAVQEPQEGAQALQSICGMSITNIKRIAENKGIYGTKQAVFIKGLAEYQERTNSKTITKELLNAIADKFGNDSRTNIVEELIQYQAL